MRASHAGRDIPAPALAARTGRGARSAIGVHGFDSGGFIVDGGRSTAPGVDGLALTRTWMTTLYHTPGDSMAQKFDFDSAAQGARFCALITQKVAQAETRPAWNRGDFFGVKYGR